MRGIALVTVLGFPIAIVLAWAFERTPGGVRRTEDADEGEVEQIAADTKRARWPVGFAAGIGTALLLWAGWWALGPESGTSGGINTDSSLDERVVAVLPFTVRGSPDIQYLGDGIVGLLSTKLDGAGNLRAVDSQTIIRIAEREGYTPGDAGSAVNVASVFGAGLYIVGEIVEAAGRMQISAALHRSSASEPLTEATIDGSTDEVFAIVDELTARLLSGLSGGPAARVQRIATVTTSSVPALKAFLEGEEHLRHGRFNLSMESFRRATEEDSLFALAYYRLAFAAEWAFANTTSVGAAAAAVRLGDRLSDRDRRILEAYQTRRTGRNLEAGEMYRSILGTYPDEMEAWLDLAEIEFHANPLHGRSFTSSRPRLERVLQLDPSHSTALIHLSRIAAYERDAAAVDSLTRKFLDLDPEERRDLEVSAIRAIGMGDSVARAEVIERFATSDDAGVAITAWGAGVFADDLGMIEIAVRELTEPRRSPEARRIGYAQLAHTEIALGHPEEARAALRGLATLSPGVALENEAIIALLPFAAAGKGELRRLRSQLRDLDPSTIATSDNPNVIFTAHDPLHHAIRFYLLGLIEAQLGNEEAALQFAAELDGLTPGPTDGSLQHDMAVGIRAELARFAGNPAEALQALESSQKHLWYAQTSSSPLFSMVRERFLMAELLVELGRPDEARPWYETIAQLSMFDLPYRRPAEERLAAMDEAASAEVTTP
jgi:TolB-like protein